MEKIEATMLQCKCGAISKHPKRNRKHYTCIDCINKNKTPKLQCSFEDFMKNGVDEPQSRIMEEDLKNDRSSFGCSLGPTKTTELQRKIKTFDDYVLYKEILKKEFEKQNKLNLEINIKQLKILEKIKPDKELTIYEWADLYEVDLQSKGYMFSERIEIYENNPTKEKMSSFYEKIHDYGVNSAERIKQIGEKQGQWKK